MHRGLRAEKLFTDIANTLWIIRYAHPSGRPTGRSTRYALLSRLRGDDVELDAAPLTSFNAAEYHNRNRLRAEKLLPDSCRNTWIPRSSRGMTKYETYNNKGQTPINAQTTTPPSFDAAEYRNRYRLSAEKLFTDFANTLWIIRYAHPSGRPDGRSTRYALLSRLRGDDEGGWFLELK